ncbi:MAG: hypothetical protein FWG93_00730 [Oscillospiraceae bacterium]|nr:hypothetical protein [Oscillospiraceae bacterium]
MGELCAISIDDLKKTRNLGAKNLGWVLLMREQFTRQGR